MLSTSQAAVKAKWNSFTYPVLPGTPLGANGAVANTSSAVGIVMERIDKKPDNPDEELIIMAGGIVDKAELGYDLSAAAVKALNGIVFRGYDVDPLPAVTAEDNGKVLGVADGAWTKVAGGGTSEENFDLVLTELAGESDSTYTLTGLSLDELYEKGFVNHKMLKLQFLQIATPDNPDPGFGGQIVDSFHVAEDEVEFREANNSMLVIEKIEDTIYVTLFDEFAYTATYDSTTKEYTLTPYTP